MRIDTQGTRSQKAAILNHLLTGESLSQLEAAQLFDCFRLGARIFDLRDDGYLIETEMVTNQSSGKRFARYYMPADEIERVKGEAA